MKVNWLFFVKSVLIFSAIGFAGLAAAWAMNFLTPLVGGGAAAGIVFGIPLLATLLVMSLEDRRA